MPSMAEAIPVAYTSDSEISLLYLKQKDCPGALVLDTTWQPWNHEYLAGITRCEHIVITQCKMHKFMGLSQLCRLFQDTSGIQ